MILYNIFLPKILYNRKEMTTIESLNSAVKMYLRGATTRYLELGEYSTCIQMLNENEYEYECLDNFIEYELIYKIGYCWTYNIHDIGTWRYDPMFSLMYRTIISNTTLITYMTDFITRERLNIGRAAYTCEYEPVDVLRNYAFYYAHTIDKDFFRQIIVQHFHQDTCVEPTRRIRNRDPYNMEMDSDSDTETERDDEPENSKLNRTPPPV